MEEGGHGEAQNPLGTPPPLPRSRESEDQCHLCYILFATCATFGMSHVMQATMFVSS